ncbi:MAG: MucB/RseB C-terminal domain-containing protein [Gammaproteobacteria bacterium]|nr:MucB/RseB C-terminal domain-containing protein [Gammaproteobacteria bacterium]MDH3371275.1 MucB/RseB C-terminal domain-containing protein [Gammaproteobacteria bacterium]MDH3405827.1 MucB/RseB C-terminal domain-containing protein [Gammaproteobacteria bacterium]MDH3561818.1 MucB/RseB C-terminal domain-containing protein [Gammaproteobacteria bacterium]MDH5486539.1 MucB/RseB C-terminal domain-containing protein [Gammaproteobacteria bacterium]
MNHRLPIRLILFITSVVFSSAAVAADPAHDWLMKINQAARTLDYDGIFVYQHESQLEAMRIIHKVENGSHRERLVSLNGAPREVIRNPREVICYWPDKNSVMVEFRKANSQTFPAILPERVQDLDEYYSIKLGNTERITGRLAQLVIVKPIDQYRYGYHLWADKETGLLLKADLLDTNGNILEQFMFTQISIGSTIPASALEPGVVSKGMVWHREEDNKATTTNKRGWTATRLPKGFRLSAYISRQGLMRKRPVEHLVYTDGLAAVSVFVEKHAKGNKPFMLGPSRMGAVNALGSRVNEYQIMTVGEVPAETIALIGGSVVPAQ